MVLSIIHPWHIYGKYFYTIVLGDFPLILMNAGSILVLSLWGLGAYAYCTAPQPVPTPKQGSLRQFSLMKMRGTDCCPPQLYDLMTNLLYIWKLSITLIQRISGIR